MATRFTTNFQRVARRVFPWFLRKPLQLSYMNVAVKEIESVNGQLDDLVEDTDFFLRWNAQVKVFTLYLNTLYDPISARIWIECVSSPLTFLRRKSEGAEKLYLYRKSEGQPQRFLKRNEDLQSDVDYIIHIPASIPFDTDQINSQIRNYNIAGMKYKIETF